MRPSPPLVQHVIASFPSKCIACARKCKCMSSVFHFVLSFTPWESLLRACRMQQDFDIYPVRTTALCLCNGLHYNLVSRLPCARIYFRQPWWWRLYVTLWQPAWMSHITWQPADWISAHQDCVHSPPCLALPPFLADPWSLDRIGDARDFKRDAACTSCPTSRHQKERWPYNMTTPGSRWRHTMSYMASEAVGRQTRHGTPARLPCLHQNHNGLPAWFISTVKNTFSMLENCVMP